MTQNEQIKGLSKMTGLSQAAIKDVITCHGQLLAAVLAGGGSIKLPGLGNFSIKATAARRGRNPSTGEAVDIPAGKRVKFSACKALKAAVN
jgi:DNA-binding protein HU-beta